MNAGVRRVPLLLIIAAIACSPAPKQPEEPPPYKPAVADYGKVNRAWIYTSGTELKAEPGTMLIAADLSLPKPEESFDLDDIDIFNADTGENFGSDPYLQRLTPNGDFVDHLDPDVAADGEYRGVFVWTVRAGVKRVNFGYWGDMLYVKPVALGTEGPILPERRVTVVQLQRLGQAPGPYDRYGAVLEARHSFRTFRPNRYMLVDSRLPKERNRCDCEVWTELDDAGRPLQLEMKQRPYLIERRLFLVEYWCPPGARPDILDLYGSRTPLPSLESRPIREEAIAALASATPERSALHRLK